MVLDCETTGFDPETCRVVEVAGVVVDYKSLKIKSTFDTLVNPGVPIPPEAMGVHHILDKDVRGRPKIGAVLASIEKEHAPFVVVAHNWEFDSKFLLLMDGGGAICTFRCAKHLWPDCPSFSNQTLRYYLRLFKEPEARAMPPHRARADAWVTAHIVRKMLMEKTVEELVELTKAPILLRKVHFGKHVGTPWDAVPKDYLQWILRQGDFDRDVVHTATHHLA